MQLFTLLETLDDKILKRIMFWNPAIFLLEYHKAGDEHEQREQGSLGSVKKHCILLL